MKKLFIILSMLFITGFCFAERYTYDENYEEIKIIEYHLGDDISFSSEVNYYGNIISGKIKSILPLFSEAKSYVLEVNDYKYAISRFSYIYVLIHRDLSEGESSLIKDSYYVYEGRVNDIGYNYLKVAVTEKKIRNIRYDEKWQKYYSTIEEP